MVDGNSSNVATLLIDHPETKGKIFFDDFSYQIYKQGILPWEDPEKIIVKEETLRPLDDFDYAGARIWIAHTLPFAENQYADGYNVKYAYPAMESLQQGFLQTASTNRRDLLRESLEDLPEPKPGKNLLNNWLYQVADIDPELPEAYVNGVGKKFLISLIARGMCRPDGDPVKVDTMLVFEGKQGIGKSQFAALLCGNDRWFADRLGDLKDKDAIALLQGRWVIEIGELAATKRSSQEDLKAYLSAPSDTFRPHYGRTTITRNRRCVFIGTTNDREYIKDHTGGRRFWPIKVDGQFNIDWLKKHRCQLLAEAKKEYERGAPWWVDSDDILHKMVTDVQSGKMMRDVEKEKQVHEYLKRWRPARLSNGGYCIECSELYMAMRIGEKPLTVYDQSAFDDVMETHGWEKKRVRLQDKRQVRAFVCATKDTKELDAELSLRSKGNVRKFQP